MDRHLSAVALALMGAIFLHPIHDAARAWELTMNGDFTSTYEYYSQQGSNGFFGTANFDQSTGAAGSLGLKPGDFASMNGWVGTRARDLVSGTDSSQHYQNLEILPKITITPAIKFQGMYRLGDYGDPVASNYVTNTRPGREVAASDGQWTMWWITTQTPWGELVLGKRPEIFGLGLQMDGAHNTTCELVTLKSNYGPLAIAITVQPFWQEPANQRLGQTASPYYNLFDKNGLRQQATRAIVWYRSATVDMGFSLMLFRWHAGPESQNREAARLTFRPYDDEVQVGSLYAKYYNGIVFLNGEVAFWDERLSRSGAPPLYNESWRYMIEGGFSAGPVTLSVLYTFLPGADRRHGALINKQPFFQMPLMGAYGVFQPYTYLLGYAYGSGVNAFDVDRQGYITEAWVAAARIDYALAANLNLFGSFLWTERSSHGHTWGFIRPAQKATVTRAVNAGGTGTDKVAWTPYVNYKDNPNAPTIPDNALGWEATVGIDWKLLERFRIAVLGAYWEPGKWFNYACVDRGVLNWDVPTAANRWGANPGRTIAPVLGAQVILTSEF